MIPASSIKNGMVPRVGKHLYKVMTHKYHVGAGWVVWCMGN